MASGQRLVVVVITLFTWNAVSAADGTSAFNQILNDFWNWRMESTPEFATKTGDHRFDDKMEVMTVEAFSRRNNEALGLLNRISSISRDSIDSSQHINYDLLKDNLETFTKGFKWRRFTYSMVSFMEGPHHGIPKLIKMMPFNTKENFETYIKRLEAFSVQILQYIDLMKLSVENGLTLHNASVKLVPDEIKTMLNANVNSTDYYLPFGVDATMNGFDASTVADLQRRGHAVIKDKIFVAFSKLREYIEKEYMPSTRPGIGISSLPQGMEFYKAVLKWHLSFDMSPEDVHQLGLNEVARIKRDMQKVMQEVNFNGTLKEFIAHLKTKSEFFYKTEEELLQGYRDIIEKRIRPKIPEYFNNPPQLPIKVEGSKSGGAAYYRRGTGDGKTPGHFFINIKDPSKRPKFDMMALSLHEVEPGHHMQVGYMLTGDMPPFRQHTEYSKYHAIPNHFPFYTAYTEGWGLYSEYVGEEMGLYATPYERFGRYVSEMLRACRLVVDTGIHAKGWSYKQAEDFMVAHLTDPVATLRAELDRYITLPGQACAYKVGEQRILQLRLRAEENLGEKFSVKSFHDPVLIHGSLPLSLLEEILNKWTRKQVSGAPSGHCTYFTLVAAFITIKLVY